MYTLYIVDNSKKSDIIGLWQDKGKIYKDYIRIKAYRDKKDLQGDISKLFLQGEQAVFYTKKNIIEKESIAYIINRQGDITKLYNRQVLKRYKLSIKEIKDLLRQHGGMTIYKYNQFYVITEIIYL